MDILTVLDHVVALLQKRGRVTYGVLKHQFALDEETLAALKDELFFSYPQVREEDGRGLVWVREQGAGGEEQRTKSEGNLESSIQEPESMAHRQGNLPLAPSLNDSRLNTAERRQLTVQFIDVVGSTTLSHQLDPEELREVIQAYRETCAAAISRFGGYLAKYIGDGLLVYFGYPQAHEDDAQRAVRAGLEIVAALPQLNARLHSVLAGHSGAPLQVRIGIHTGLVVAGEMGVGDQPEPLAIVGETPNVAARIQGLAEPNLVLISAATQRLIAGQFDCQPFGSHLVKGLETPVAVYHVQSERQSTSPLAGRTLTPLVGREQEVGLLLNRWEQAKEGHGQVVLLSGEPGIGKSRLAYALREQVTREGSLLFEARCSLYHQHSAFYPLIDAIQRTLLLTRYATNNEKVETLERALALYNLQASLPLFTALLSLPMPSHHPALNLTPQKQKERTLAALAQLFVAQAERQATVVVWEDLHWVDPSSLEFLSTLIAQLPTTQLLLVLTFRPDFTPGWKPHSHVSQLVLTRLGKHHVEAMITQVAEEHPLPVEVVEQIISKTDGVPLFVEELTKSVVESVGVAGVGAHSRAPLQLAIPATLQEALLARLDRLSEARQVAQLGATLGREFLYELLHAVSSLSEEDLRAALAKLVEAEILYQRGVGEQARYFFKHALIQDMAYQSLLKSTRQQLHQQIAHVLATQFPNTKETQPELLAHHYTEAGLMEQAISYWQQAGQRAVQHSANVEAVAHFTKGLALLKALPETPDRISQELTLQLALGVPLMATKGYAAPEVEKTYARARVLCQQMGESPQLFSVLYGLWAYFQVRGEYPTARELGNELLSLAQTVQDSALLLIAHWALGETLLRTGEFVTCREHLEQGITLYNREQYHRLAFLYGIDPGVGCRNVASASLCYLGYPDQALRRSQEALTLAHELSHPFSLGHALLFAAKLHLHRREGQLAQQRAEAGRTLAIEQGFAFWLAGGTFFRGGALADQGQAEEGIEQMRQGLDAAQATGAQIDLPGILAALAEAYGKVGQVDEGLHLLDEATTVMCKNENRCDEAELYRLKGELMLQPRAKGQGIETGSLSPQASSLKPLAPMAVVDEVEGYFLKAIEIARHQQAKSLELRASTSLARLWQSQGKKAEAHQLLSEIYDWFTEGFDTKDLQEAKALLDELKERQP